MTRIYLEDVNPSLAIRRVVRALREHAPVGVEFVDNAQAADLVVVQVNGRLEHLKRHVASMDRPYVLVQHAFRSTKNPEVKDWLRTWRAAELVWTHYDLGEGFDYYRSPLGVDPVFSRRAVESQDYLCLTSGASYLSEGVREVIMASQGRKLAHLGHNVARKGWVDTFYQLTDDELATLYSRCQFVSGLRRVEGFELPAAEGLVCGARPVMFDREHYRHWYGDMAEYIPELPRPDVERALTDLFSRPPRVVTNEEMDRARKLFDWGTIIRTFYERIGVRAE